MEVLVSNNHYKMENNFYTKYVVDKITQTDDSKDIISRDILYSDFKKWYVVENDPKTVPKKVEFEKYISKLIGEPHRRKGYIKVKFT